MKTPRRPRDVAQLALAVVQEATAETEETVEELAREFWEDTQIVAPVQGIHPPLVDKWGEEVRWQRWQEWLVRRKMGAGGKPNRVAAGRIGGLKGGKARAEKLSPERRQEIAKKAAAARWAKKPENSS